MVVISLDAYGAVLDQIANSLHNRDRIRSVPDEVAENDKSLDGKAFDSGKRSIKCFKVAVNVGQKGYAHVTP